MRESVKNTIIRKQMILAISFADSLSFGTCAFDASSPIYFGKIQAVWEVEKPCAFSENFSVAGQCGRRGLNPHCLQFTRRKTLGGGVSPFFRVAQAAGLCHPGFIHTHGDSSFRIYQMLPKGAYPNNPKGLITTMHADSYISVHGLYTSKN